ncbi:transmembrane protein [Ceratobasidium sp. AG-Ba]|nr:transmembrane protein [Ceratobasidium sp. AG-Ba]
MNWLRRLEYPRVQTYAIPWITEIFYVVSFIVIALLATLNVAIAGNDVVTELKDSPNNTDSKAPHAPTTLHIYPNKLFVTYLFIYPTERIGNQSEWNPKMDRGHKLTSHIICSINTNNSDTPPTLKFSTTFSRMANTDLGQDDIVDYISSYVVPRYTDIKDARPVFLANDSTPLNMLGVLDAFGSELLKALWARKWTWKIAGNESWPDQAVVKWSSEPTCWQADSNDRCRRNGPETGGIDGWYSNTKGSQDDHPVYLTPMNTTLFNYFVAMRDAIHLDLGNVNTSTNIFLSKDAFRQRIRPDPFMNWTAPFVVNQTRPDNGSYTHDAFFKTCTWGWGCIIGTWTDALLTEDPRQNISRGLPIDDFQGPTYATVIDVKYVCPVFRPKRIGALLLSVFIGTFSMYTALYGAFLFIAPKMDEWYRRRRGLSRFSMDLDELGPYSSVVGPFAYQTPPHSSQPYRTVFDATDMYHYNEAAPRYDPAPYPGPTSTNRKGTLPPGAYLPTLSPHSEHQPEHQRDYLPPIASSSTLTLNNLAHRRESASPVDPPPDSDQEALLPGCFESDEPSGPSTSGTSSRTAIPEQVTFVPAATEHPVSVENGHRLSRVGDSFKATVVGGSTL